MRARDEWWIMRDARVRNTKADTNWTAVIILILVIGGGVIIVAIKGGFARRDFNYWPLGTRDPRAGPALTLLILGLVYALIHASAHSNEYQCQKCGFRFNHDELTLVCPHCGSEDIKPVPYPFGYSYPQGRGGW